MTVRAGEVTGNELMVDTESLSTRLYFVRLRVRDMGTDTASGKTLITVGEMREGDGLRRTTPFFYGTESS